MERLDDLTDAMDAECVDILGDSIAYTPDGGAQVSLRAFVDISDDERQIGGNDAVVEDYSIQIRIVDAPALSKDDVIVVSKMSGQAFSPVGILRDSSGRWWNARLRRIKSA